MISVRENRYEAGRPVTMTVEIRNVSDRPVWMVGVLDGSEAGFRYPKYSPRIVAPRPLARREEDGCGMVAPLRIEDFLLLLPGESFDPTRPAKGAAYLSLALFNGFVPHFPGRYQASLTLSTESADPNEWLGVLERPGKEEVLAKLALVPRLRVESNVAVFEAM